MENKVVSNIPLVANSVFPLYSLQNMTAIEATGIPDIITVTPRIILFIIINFRSSKRIPGIPIRVMNTMGYRVFSWNTFFIGIADKEVPITMSDKGVVILPTILIVSDKNIGNCILKTKISIAIKTAIIPELRNFLTSNILFGFFWLLTKYIPNVYKSNVHGKLKIEA